VIVFHVDIDGITVLTITV